MPVQPCEADGQSGYQYGPSGKCYTYPPGDEAARKEAKRKAHLQGATIEAAGGKAVGQEAVPEDLNNRILPQDIKGLYLVAPHGRLVSDGTKTAVVKAKPRPTLEGRWVVVSKEDGYGWAFGLADLGPVEELAATDFKARYAEHQVGEGDRLRWWQDADPLYLYPVTGFKAFEQPVEVVVPPGTQTVMRAVEVSRAADEKDGPDSSAENESPREGEKEESHSRSRCMSCSQQPQIQVRWADGRGLAWFCMECFKKWANEEEREIVAAWALPDGQAADKPKEVGLPSITVKGRTPQELARAAQDKVDGTKDLTIAAPTVCPVCNASVGPITEAGLVCPNCGARLRAGTIGGTTEGVSYDDKSYTDKAFDGVYLLMFLEDADADAIAGQLAESGIDNPEPAENLHVTVASLGELDGQRFALARGALWAQAQVLPPVEGVLGGVGKFGKPGDDAAPFYAVYDAPGLDAFRGRLLAALAAMGIEPDGEHGYSPHITLAYAPYDSPLPALRGRKLRLRTLSLSCDGDTVDFRLEGKAGEKGGPGSGHWVHEGRPGLVGGSKPGRGLAYLGLTGGSSLVERREASDSRRGTTTGGGAGKPEFGLPRVGTDGYAYPDENTKKMDAFLYDSTHEASISERGAAKHEICTELSERTGISYEEVNSSIREWADSSNDHNPESLQFQLLASDMFNSQLSEWQKDCIDDWQDVGLPADLSVADSKTFLQAMYDNTQETLRDQGFKPTDQITLYRGVYSDMPYSSVGEVINFRGNTMESWTTRRNIADRFGNKRLVMTVPIERIIGTARTGFGCLSEWEIIVLGGGEHEIYRER